MALSAEGASAARGEVLFFTESHVWPTPDVLAKCRDVLAAHPEWSAFSCTSERVTSNRLSVVEADMYEADIAYGMTEHPWRKILDQCFVTRRTAYVETGGFPAEYGHFAEWVLAARYHARGFTIGHVPEIRLRHQYSGHIGVLREFTCDFIDGEAAFLGRPRNRPGDELIETPPEWEAHANWDRHIARAIVASALRDAHGPNAERREERHQRAPRIVQWLPAALVGTGFDRAAAAIERWRARAVVAWANRFGTLEQTRGAFQTYTTALIRGRRLRHAAERNASRRRMARVADRLRWTPGDPGTVAVAGAHQPEVWAGVTFRWSEAVAVACGTLRPGRYVATIECAPIRRLGESAAVRFFHNGERIPADQVTLDGWSFRMPVTVPRSGRSAIVWICDPFPAPGDARTLGLPLIRVGWTTESDATREAEADDTQPADGRAPREADATLAVRDARPISGLDVPAVDP
ncbi:MAG: glycosyltransferase family 2 protein [Acidobacteria bacterium]|nr:glycosyltransferase family 2 protein [Acidobacteriota bacterium]